MEKSDIFVVKYDMNGQQELESHSDGSNITISIMLSDTKDYMGGGTHFESDQTVYYLEKGDILIHNGKDRHAGLKITKGTRYVLVMFINI
jgi:predicted 2-oxoglutarate/Fe(II)-dependent dioxygenase YbiX